MSSSLLKSFKEGVLPEEIKKNSEKEVKEVSAPKVEVTKEETELERLFFKHFSDLGMNIKIISNYWEKRI